MVGCGRQSGCLRGCLRVNYLCYDHPLTMSKEVQSWAHDHKEVIKLLEQLDDVDNYPHNYFYAAHIYSKIRSEPSLRGESLHFLFKVLGHHNVEMIANLCLKVPGHILVKACSRSATYGKNLVQPYLN